MNICVVNESNEITDKYALAAMVQAMTKQLVQAAPLWDRRPSKVSLAKSLDAVPAGSPFVVLLDDSDQADALGYHDQTPDGRPYGRVFAKPTLANGGTLYRGANSVSCTLSHEVLELWADPNCNAWYDTPKGDEVAFELCDPVEADVYSIKIGTFTISVSNFVLPAYFDTDPEPGDRFDYLGLLSKPFTMTTGGYLIKRKNGKVTNVFGKTYPKWKKKQKGHAASRTARRA